jgi:hypothetical protein
MVLSPGIQTVEARAKDRQGSGTFDCRADERLYLAIETGGSARNHLAIVLKRFDPATANALIADMARILH